MKNIHIDFTNILFKFTHLINGKQELTIVAEKNYLCNYSKYKNIKTRNANSLQ